MWDCTVTSPTNDKGPISVPLSPKAKRTGDRAKGDPHWATFNSLCTPEEAKVSPLTEYASSRAFKVVRGKLACKMCDDGILRTTAGHDMHYRTQHEGLEVYGSFKAGSESSAGGRVNATIPEGRSPNRAGLLKELHACGVTAKELAAEGYRLSELQQARYTFKEILATGSYSLEQLHAAGVTRNLKASGISAKDLFEAGYTLTELRKAGFSCEALKQATDADLASLRAAGFPLHELRVAGYSLSELKELRRGGSKEDPAFTLQDLKKEGYTCKELRKVGFTLADLKSGYSAADLKVTQFTTKAELALDGYPLQELKLAGVSTGATRPPPAARAGAPSPARGTRALRRARRTGRSTPIALP